MRFIDFLNVFQDHPEGNLPIVGKELISRQDMETGEIRETCNTKKIEGSFSTSLQIRCDGTRVSVEGNPSRWGRVDNLFGFTTFDECIQIYNTELLKLDLPPFTKCIYRGFNQSRDDKHERFTDGARFRRVDWTRNLSVGKDNVHPFLRGFSSHRIGKGIIPNLYADGNTLEWFTSLWYHKLYNKSAEMQLRRNINKYKYLTENEKEYLSKIIKYCEDNGVVRDEKQFNRDFLVKRNLNEYGSVRESDFLIYLNDIDKLINKIEVSTMDYENVSDLLIEKDICKSRQSANATQSYVFQWLYGQKIKRNSQFYVHKQRLLQLGIDISVPHDTTRLMPQLRNNREVYVSTILPPDWYELPNSNNFLKVA